MISLPHDTADVLLAPVTLALDQQLQQCSALTQLELLQLVALSTDREPHSMEHRRSLMLDTLSRDIDRHDWSLSWDPRGLRLHHAERTVVLGLPASLRTFLGVG